MDSLVGFVGKNYVLMAGDTNAGRSIMRLKDDFDKLVPIDSHKILAKSGEIGDGNQFCNLIIRNVSLYRIRNETELTTKSVAHYTRRQLATAIRKNPYSVNLLLGGYDKKDQKGSLYYLDYLGSSKKINYGAQGYAALFVGSILDRFWKEDLDFEDGLELMKKCLREVEKRLIIGTRCFLIKMINSDGISVVEKDDILARAVSKFKGKEWESIAQYFKDKDATQCLHRWQKVLNPDLKKGKWTDEEDTLLLKYVKEIGESKWSIVAQKIPQRTSKQCRERWKNQLDPSLNHGPWTKEEDEILIQKHKELGNKWSQIKRLLPGRSDNMIKNRWNSTLRKIANCTPNGLLESNKKRGRPVGSKTKKKKEKPKKKPRKRRNSKIIKKIVIPSSKKNQKSKQHLNKIQNPQIEEKITNPKKNENPLKINNNVKNKNQLLTRLTKLKELNQKDTTLNKKNAPSFNKTFPNKEKKENNESQENKENKENNTKILNHKYIELSSSSESMTNSKYSLSSASFESLSLSLSSSSSFSSSSEASSSSSSASSNKHKKTKPQLKKKKKPTRHSLELKNKSKNKEKRIHKHKHHHSKNRHKTRHKNKRRHKNQKKKYGKHKYNKHQKINAKNKNKKEVNKNLSVEKYHINQSSRNNPHTHHRSRSRSRSRTHYHSHPRSRTYLHSNSHHKKHKLKKNPNLSSKLNESHLQNPKNIKRSKLQQSDQIETKPLNQEFANQQPIAFEKKQIRNISNSNKIEIEKCKGKETNMINDNNGIKEDESIKNNKEKETVNSIGKFLSKQKSLLNTPTRNNREDFFSNYSPFQSNNTPSQAMLYSPSSQFDSINSMNLDPQMEHFVDPKQSMVFSPQINRKREYLNDQENYDPNIINPNVENDYLYISNSYNLSNTPSKFNNLKYHNRSQIQIESETETESELHGEPQFPNFYASGFSPFKTPKTPKFTPKFKKKKTINRNVRSTLKNFTPKSLFSASPYSFGNKNHIFPTSGTLFQSPGYSINSPNTLIQNSPQIAFNSHNNNNLRPNATMLFNNISPNYSPKKQF
ncbi:transcription repressor myb5 [Anaeramoeba flamelloides]|uniref:Transcription repressor myb5 n=1 Tax=Anaeramoeba flamelloides TaxID=1746091 RepID=A0ABQ8YY14_9EUKA|nr:transcription repressor myb5 [Anaeramoeba flamelloides]